MKDDILSGSGRTFHKFIAYLTDQLSRPKTNFISQMLCGVLFSENLILTNVASKVPRPGRLTAIAKRFRRQLAESRSFLKVVLFNYPGLVQAAVRQGHLGCIYDTSRMRTTAVTVRAE